jgi:hypothetical protein
MRSADLPMPAKPPAGSSRLAAGVIAPRVTALLPNKDDWRAVRRDPPADLVAGLTVAVVAVPLALAFGVAAGMGARAGLHYGSWKEVGYAEVSAQEQSPCSAGSAATVATSSSRSRGRFAANAASTSACVTPPPASTPASRSVTSASVV